MYVPQAFSVADRGFALELISRYPFGLLIACSGDYPEATHIPMLAQERDESLWIVGHVARANPHAAAILDGERATAVFRGPHAYVSAGWYEEPFGNVPTWNYTAVQASGRLAQCDARPILALLTARFEGDRTDPWQIERLEPAYNERQLGGIVAFEMRVERLHSAAKLSQNRSPADRARVEAQLAQSKRPEERDCADAMRAIQSPEDDNGAL